MEFISYASDYDMFVGRRSIAEINAQEQDELIRLVFAQDGDFREMVVRLDIKKSQAEGLWAIVVFVGLALEGARVIKNFERRDNKDTQEIIAFLSGTKLWLRLEEAFPPFDFREKKTDYNWRELEKIRIERLTEATGEPLYKVKSKLCEYLSPSPSELQSQFIERMPYHAFKQGYEEGKLRLFVDRGLSPVAGRAGYVTHPLLSVLPLIFFGGLLAFVPVWFFFGFWYAFAVVAVVMISKSALTKILLDGTRRAAIKDRHAYRWLLSRRIIWLQYVWS